MTTLVDKILALDESLDRGGFDHAFGGALALAWCTERARGTVNIDLNVFVSGDRAAAVLGALPAGVTHADVDRELLERDGQVRVWWDGTPVDLFLNTTDFHEAVAGRARREPFAGREVPFLGCADLAVFKAFFNRTRDWADLEAMADAGSLDRGRVAEVLATYLGPGDERVVRVLGL